MSSRPSWSTGASSRTARAVTQRNLVLKNNNNKKHIKIKEIQAVMKRGAGGNIKGLRTQWLCYTLDKYEN